MKSVSIILIGNLLLNLITPASAQWSYPPGRTFRDQLFRQVARAARADGGWPDSNRLAAREKARVSRTDTAVRKKDGASPADPAFRMKAGMAQADTTVREKPGASAAEIAVLRGYCERLSAARRRIFYLNDQVFRMSLQVRGIYTKAETVFFQLAIANHSNLDYDMDSIRFYITDRPKRKEAPVILSELSPVCVYGHSPVLHGKSREVTVIALPRFTLPVNRRLVIQILEKNGGRHLQLDTDNSTLVRARSI